MKTLIRSRTKIPISSITNIFKNYGPMCSMTQDSMYMSLEEGQLFNFTIEIHLCLDQKNIVYKARVTRDDFKGKPFERFFEVGKPNHLMVKDSTGIKLRLHRRLLQLVYYKELKEEKVFSDFFLIEFSGAISDSNTKMDVSKFTRKHFTQITKDFSAMPLKEPELSSDRILPITYYDWSIMSTLKDRYILKIRWERWDLNMTSKTMNVSTQYPAGEVELTLKEDLVPGTVIKICKNNQLKIVDHSDEKYLWIELQSRIYENLLLRYDRVSVFLNKNVSATPKIWRLSNPFFGFEVSTETESIKSDWLYLKIRVFDNLSFLMVYLVPPSIMDGSVNEISTISARETIELLGFRQVRLNHIHSSQGTQSLT